MSRRDRRDPGGQAALGFAPHSGWAVVVAVDLEDGEPRILLRRRVDLADPKDPGSKQPYHAVEKLPIDEAGRRVAAWEAQARRLADGAVAGLIAELADAGRRAAAAGILDAASRRRASLAEILASHAFIHAAEGDHFRDAIASASATRGLPVARVRARELEARAAEVVGRTPERLRKVLRALGREIGPPWAADQKAAALVGWLALAETFANRARP